MFQEVLLFILKRKVWIRLLLFVFYYFFNVLSLIMKRVLVDVAQAHFCVWAVYGFILRSLRKAKRLAKIQLLQHTGIGSRRLKHLI